MNIKFPSAAEMAISEQWFGGAEDVSIGTGSLGRGPAFSFVYDDKLSADFLKSWPVVSTSEDEPNGHKVITTWRDSATGLVVIQTAKLYADASAVEWTLQFRNDGMADTPILEKILALDLNVHRDPAAKVPATLYHALGSRAKPDDFLPSTDTLPLGKEIMYPAPGEVSQAHLPYFTLGWQGGGVAGGIGWTGQWALRIACNQEGTLSVQAGQQNTHLTLHPGESIRTPRILLAFWLGDETLRGPLQLRHVLTEHYLPRVDGKTVSPLISQNSFYLNGYGNGVNEANQLETIAQAAQVGAEAYWMDAGWFLGGWPNGVGSWDPRPDAFPNGLKPLSDAAHAAEMKFILWFEPERVASGSIFDKEHPQWLLRNRKADLPGPGNPPPAEGFLFNLGDPDALHFLTDYIDERIKKWGIDIYRQDRNFYPFAFWDVADAPDRQGITENHHVQGLYAFWDALLARNPDLIIDNANWRCTGNDIETFLRTSGSWTCCETDDGRDPIPNQVQQLSLGHYVPTQASLLWSFDPYPFRSVTAAGSSICFSTDPTKIDMTLAKKAIAEAKLLRPCQFGDFYPLTPCVMDDTGWCGWQRHRSDLHSGFALLFRRSGGSAPTFSLVLNSLDPNTTYELAFYPNYDLAEHHLIKGGDSIDIHTDTGTLLVRYQPVG